MLVDGIFYFVILALMVAALVAALHLWDPQDAHDDRSGATSIWAAIADRVIHPRAHHRH